MSEAYVPQIGDLVKGIDDATGRGERATGQGIYIGSKMRTHRGMEKRCYGVLKPDGVAVLLDHIQLTDAWTYKRYGQSTEAEAAEVLTDICLAFDDGPAAGAAALGYRDNVRGREMPAEMARWWAKARGPMMKQRFGDAIGEAQESARAVAEIRRLDGEPSIALQEKHDAAQHKIEIYRMRICQSFAAEISAAQKTLGIGPQEKEILPY